MVKRYIAVAGNIGAGKSCLVDFLCRHYNVKPFYEPVEANPYLEDFYKNMRRWAYHSQLYYLAHKFRIHLELEKYRGTVVLDRTIYEDSEIFATNLYRQGYMDKRDFATYQDLYRVILKTLQPPDIMIYLECSVRALKKRIRKRGRVIEQKVPDDYLKRLNRLYKRWIEKYKLSPLIVFNTERYDYLSDFIARRDLLSKIEKYL